RDLDIAVSHLAAGALLKVDRPPVRRVACPPMSSERTDVLYGTLALLILKTLDAMGPLHGYALARRIEQVSKDQIALNQGTLYPALRKLHHKGWITAKAGETDTGRQARFYAITKSGRAQLDAETANWDRATAIVARFVKGLS